MSDSIPKNMNTSTLPPPILPGLHAGSKSDFGDIDIDEMIEKMGCSKQYYALEECLGEYDRDWTKCQQQVKLLKLCNERVMHMKQAKPYQSFAPTPQS